MMERRVLQTLAATGPLPEFRAAIRAAGGLSPSARQALEFVLAARSGDFAAARSMLPRLAGESARMREGLASTLRRVPERSDPRAASRLDELVAALEAGGAGTAATSPRNALPRWAPMALTGVGVLAIGVLVGMVFSGGFATPRPPAAGTPTTTRSGGEFWKDAGGGSGSSATGSSSGGAYGQRPDPPPQPTPPSEPGPDGTAPADPGGSVSPFGGGSPADGQGVGAGAGDGPSATPGGTPAWTGTPPPPDSDADGVPDDKDPCPENRDVKDLSVDTDGDGVPDGCDNCPSEPNPRGTDGKQTDFDGDEVGDACDNCPKHPNERVDGKQADLDGDEVGDDCECEGAENDSTMRGVKGVDCDERGMPLSPNGGKRGGGPSSAKITFPKSSDAIVAIERSIAAWRSPDTGKGSARECETMREALSALAGALALLADELPKGRDEIYEVRNNFVAGPRTPTAKAAALAVIDARDKSTGELFQSCLSLLTQVCVKGPEPCLEGSPIVESGLVAATTELENVAKGLGKQQFKFRGEPSKPRSFLEGSASGISALRGLWDDFVRDARRGVDPAKPRSPVGL